MPTAAESSDRSTEAGRLALLPVSPASGSDAGRQSWDCQQLEPVRCGFCGADTTRPVCVRPDGLRVVECLICGLAYVNPRPLPEVVARIYDDAYFGRVPAANGRFGYVDYTEEAQSWLAGAELDRLARHVSLKGQRVLEVGCATGDLLARMRNLGADVLGLDVSEFAARTARQRHGVEVIAGVIDTPELDGRQFDIVIGLEVVEHTFHPVGFVRRVAELVTPGGFAMLSTPNYRCARILGENWRGFNGSFEHLCFLSDDVLSRMGAAAGLEEVTWYTLGDGRYQHPGNLSPMQRLRQTVKRLPGVARAWSAWKSVATRRRPPYAEHGQGHRLLMIFTKPAA